MKTQKTILLVEDNANDELLTIRALRKNHLSHQIKVARDGEQAIDLLFGLSEGFNINSLPDLILLDINLPKMNGLEVLQQLRNNERTKYIPVVMLTSSIEKRDIQSSYKLKANSYIQKPVDFIKFVEVVNHIGKYWLELNIPLNTTY